jgi:CubicO group peptidase (beta-lactamase class C family)
VNHRTNHNTMKSLFILLCAIPITVAFAQTAAPDRFKQRDKNADGKLSGDELPYPNLFKRYDKDGDGALSPEEAAAIRTTGPGQPAAPSTPPTTPSAAPQGDFKPRPHGEEATKAGLKPEVLAKLDIAMQQAVANKEVSGVIGLIHHNGQRGYFEAFGMQDIEAATPMAKDSIFRLQSMSKPVVTVAALTLLDEGKFTLDEPISKHLPEWAEPKVLENGQLVPAKFAITPRLLMSHSSGLYYGDIQKGAFTGGAASRDDKTTLDSHSKSLAAKPLKFHPGEGYAYGTSIDVLGRYIEVVSGKPLDEFLKERVLGPLKMVDTDFWVHPENVSRIAQLYTQRQPGTLTRGREAAQVTTKPTIFLGGQGLCSTAADYERFCRMVMNRGELDGARVLKPETVDLMFQNHLKPELGQKYGLGGAVDGEGGYSWGGANGTQFWLDRTKNLFAIFMVQTQLYKAPTYGTFKTLANDSAGVASGRGVAAGGGGGGGAEASGSQFKQRDKSGDGKLGPDEIPAALFDKLDLNKDGFVTEEEAKVSLQRR